MFAFESDHELGSVINEKSDDEEGMKKGGKTEGKGDEDAMPVEKRSRSRSRRSSGC